MVAAMLSLMFILALDGPLDAQSLGVSHAKVSDLLVVFAAKADRILVSGTIHGLLIIRIPLAVQILLHNDYALGVELFWRIKIILTNVHPTKLINKPSSHSLNKAHQSKHPSPL